MRPLHMTLLGAAGVLAIGISLPVDESRALAAGDRPMTSTAHPPPQGPQGSQPKTAPTVTVRTPQARPVRVSDPPDKVHGANPSP
jgi:hypothetical protein